MRCQHFAFLLLALCLPGAQAETDLVSMADDALARLNDPRAEVGLPPLQRNPLLDRSAAAHASYPTRHRSLASDGHHEDPARPGYTGRTPGERIDAVGYRGSRSAENLALVSYPVGALCTDNLIDAPYHRAA